MAICWKQLNINEDDYNKIRALAVKDGATMYNVVNKAIDVYVRTRGDWLQELVRQWNGVMAEVRDWSTDEEFHDELCVAFNKYLAKRKAEEHKERASLIEQNLQRHVRL